MKKNITEIASGEKITRRQAIQKAGIATLTATSLMFLQTKASSATSMHGDSAGSAASLRDRRSPRSGDQE